MVRDRNSYDQKKALPMLWHSGGALGRRRGARGQCWKALVVVLY